MNPSVTVTRDTATPTLREIIARCQPSRLGVIMGRAGANVIKRRLDALPSNKKGWPTTNFWRDASRQTTSRPLSDGAVIAIAKQGFRQRVNGGVIKPVNAKALTIPVSPVSYGHVAADFPRLFLLKTPKGAYLAQRDEAPAGKENKADRTKRRKGMGGNWKRRQTGRLNILFKLSSGVNQQPTPNALPADDVFTAALTAELDNALPA